MKAWQFSKSQKPMISIINCWSWKSLKFCLYFFMFSSIRISQKTCFIFSHVFKITRRPQYLWVNLPLRNLFGFWVENWLRFFISRFDDLIIFWRANLSVSSLDVSIILSWTVLFPLVCVVNYNVINCRYFDVCVLYGGVILLKLT